jgi:Flp pilus assembly protein TadB
VSEEVKKKKKEETKLQIRGTTEAMEANEKLERITENIRKEIRTPKEEIEREIEREKSIFKFGGVALISGEILAIIAAFTANPGILAVGVPLIIAGFCVLLVISKKA